MRGARKPSMKGPEEKQDNSAIPSKGNSKKTNTKQPSSQAVKQSRKRKFGSTETEVEINATDKRIKMFDSSLSENDDLEEQKTRIERLKVC